MARSVKEIERICLSIMDIIHLDSVTFYCYALLLFEVHGVEDLIFHVAGCQSVGYFQHSVRQSTFSMVNMGNNTKVSCLLHFICNNPRKDNSNFSIFVLNLKASAKSNNR